MSDNNREIEAKFLEIDVESIKRKLLDLGAIDEGEDLLREVIFNKDEWCAGRQQFVRIRQTKDTVLLAFKDHGDQTLGATQEIEFAISDAEQVRKFLEAVGLTAFREQEKKRHKFRLGEVTVDIDTWPLVPPYLELEGPSKESLKAAARSLGLDWSKAVFGSARLVIEDHYHVPLSPLKHFTFGRIE